MPWTIKNLAFHDKRVALPVAVWLRSRRIDQRSVFRELHSIGDDHVGHRNERASSLFLIGAPAEMMSSARDAGQGAGIAGFLFLIFLPLPGILGWFTGRAIAWILRL